jgi:hypothetical protein
VGIVQGLLLDFFFRFLLPFYLVLLLFGFTIHDVYVSTQTLLSLLVLFISFILYVYKDTTLLLV